MPLYQRSTETGIEFINQNGDAVAGIRDDGTVWGLKTAAGGASAPGATGPAGPKGEDGAGVQAQAVTITPPKDLASCVAATRAIINVLHDAGITV